MENVSYCQQMDAIIGVFKGFMSMDEHQKIANKILKLAKEKNVSKLVIDVTYITVMSLDTTEWIEKQWFPKAKAQGINEMTFIVPRSRLSLMSVENVNSKAAEIDIKYIDELEAIEKFETKEEDLVEI